MISEKEFKHLEELSKLEFSKVEREKFLKDFNSVVEFASQVSKADADLSKLFVATHKLADLRPDEVKESFPQQDIISNAPNKKNGCFVVPRIME